MDPPPDDGPLALLAFGTAYTDRIDVYHNTIEALDGTAWRLTIATGRVQPDNLGAVPDWVQLRPTVPQPAVLRIADAFVTHAGMASCILGIAADPQVRLRLNEIRVELHRVGGPGHAADAVEDAATGHW